MGAYCYAVNNILSGLASSSFTFDGATSALMSRLNDARMDKQYISGSPVNAHNVVIDLGSARALTGFAVLNSNIAVQKPGCALTITGADNAGITINPVVAKAGTAMNGVAPKNKDHTFQFASVTKRYWLLNFDWSGVGGGTIANFKIGELWAFANQARLSRKSVYGGGGKEEIKTSAVDFYNGGSRSYFLGGPVRSYRLPFTDLAESEREELATMWRATQGDSLPFLWIPSYEATALAAANAEQEVIYGKLMLNEFAWSENDYQLFDAPELVVRSLGREIGA